MESAIRQALFEQLRYYTLTRGTKDPLFRHQHVVDAFRAQHPADGAELAEALVGLYLNVEKGFDGRRVLRVRRRLAKALRRWPSWRSAPRPPAMTAAQVLATAPGPVRDGAIDAWCAAVWKDYGPLHQDVVSLLAPHGLAPRKTVAN